MEGMQAEIYRLLSDDHGEEALEKDPTLDPDQARKVSFNITPGEPTDLAIVVDYKIGVNPRLHHGFANSQKLPFMAHA